jgi:two-component system chemotaxis response regulator CheY
MKKKILVIDDSATVRRQVASTLALAGYDAVEADSGANALGAIRANPGFAMAIADVNMPNMDGIEMLRWLRQTDVTPTLPVLMLTSEGDPDLVAAARNEGAKGWIIKPYRPDVLLAAVRKLAGEP